jgi:Family of unknown function (DUF6174)
MRSYSNRALIVAAVLLSATLDSWGQDPATQQLSRAQLVWSAAKLNAYEFALRFTCGTCPPVPPGISPTAFVVRGGRSSLKGAVAVPQHLENYSTIEKLFEFIRTALAREPLRVEIEYDQKLGYPRRVYIDPSRASDDEHAFVVEDFTILR